MMGSNISQRSGNRSVSSPSALTEATISQVSPMSSVFSGPARADALSALSPSYGTRMEDVDDEDKKVLKLDHDYFAWCLRPMIVRGEQQNAPPKGTKVNTGGTAQQDGEGKYQIDRPIMSEDYLNKYSLTFEKDVQSASMAVQQIIFVTKQDGTEVAFHFHPDTRMFTEFCSVKLREAPLSQLATVKYHEKSVELFDYVNMIMCSPPRPVFTTELLEGIGYRCNHILRAFNKQPADPLHTKFGFDSNGSENSLLKAVAKSVTSITVALTLKKDPLMMAFSQRLFLQTGANSFRYVETFCRIKLEIAEDCKEFIGDQLNFYMYTVYVEVIGMVLKRVAQGQLSHLNDPNDRQERIEFWVKAMKDEFVCQVMSSFTQAVDKDAMMADNGPTGWMFSIKKKMARLADDILLFQVAHGGPFKLFSVRAFKYFEVIWAGKLYGEYTADAIFPHSVLFAAWARELKEKHGPVGDAESVVNSAGDNGQ